MDSNLVMVGIIGGLSHESSDSYSAGIHRLVNQALGGLSNAELVQYDVNFSEIYEDMQADKWSDIGLYLSNVAEALTSIGAQYVAVASNTMHKIAPDIKARIGANRFIHIADCIGQRCVEVIDGNRILWPELYDKTEPRRALLLGTLETMTGDFLRGRLEQYGLAVNTPDDASMKKLDNRIFNELCHGQATIKTQKWYLRMLQDTLNRQPVDVIILGCTELSLLYDESDLARLTSVLNANGNRPLVVIDSKKSHIIGIAKACLGQWVDSDF